MKLSIPYGNGSLKFFLPENRLAGILKNRGPAKKDIKKLIASGLSGDLLERLVIGKKKVLIVVPDATRSAHLKELLPALLGKISRGRSRKVDIIVATGLHKKHSQEELKKLLGVLPMKRCQILQHDPSKESVIAFGRTGLDIPVTLDKHLFDYDFVVSAGVIEPHLYAGYSGGAKTIAIGLAGVETINATHSIKFLDNPLTTIGSLKSNPFQETLLDIIDKIQPVFSVNTVNNSDGEALKIFSGMTKDVFRKGTDFAKKVFEVKARAAADVAICGIGYPKDINLYQASRAINYCLNVDRPVVRKGGVVIVAAELKDGIGHSAAEHRFYEELKLMRSPEEFVRRVKRVGCVAGEHRTYMVAKAMIDYNVIFVTKGLKEFARSLPFESFESISEALNRSDELVGKGSRIYVIPRSLATIASLPYGRAPKGTKKAPKKVDKGVTY